MVAQWELRSVVG